MSFAQMATQDSLSLIRGSFDRQAVYLKDGFFDFSNKIVQGAFEYPAGKYYQDLPLYLSAAPILKMEAQEVINRRTDADLYGIFGFVASAGLYIYGVGNQHDASMLLGALGYLATPLYLQYETIRFKKDLSRLIFEYNKSLLWP